jgi:hypothetical protein
MIRFLTGENGKTHAFVIGLTYAELDRLRDGDTLDGGLVVREERAPPTMPVELLVYAGASDDAMMASLEQQGLIPVKAAAPK